MGSFAQEKTLDLFPSETDTKQHPRQKGVQVTPSKSLLSSVRRWPEDIKKQRPSSSISHTMCGSTSLCLSVHVCQKMKSENKCEQEKNQFATYQKGSHVQFSYTNFYDGKKANGKKLPWRQHMPLPRRAKEEQDMWITLICIDAHSTKTNNNQNHKGLEGKEMFSLRTAIPFPGIRAEHQRFVFTSKIRIEFLKQCKTPVQLPVRDRNTERTW